MRNLKLTLAYDGTHFHGWQIQPELRTIQGELEQALRKLFNHEIRVTGSGRTDAGVHAHGQVANVQTVRTMDTTAVLRGANALLPCEIRVVAVDEVGPEFHARRSARMKFRSEEHTSELQSLTNLVCRLLLEKKNEHAPDPSLREGDLCGVSIVG